MKGEVSEIFVLLTIGTVIVLLLASAVIFFVIFYQKRMLQNKLATQALESAYQKQLLQSTIDSQEKERKRIASDLHDGVGAMLSAAKLNLNMLKRGTISNEELPEVLVDTNTMIDETIETVRKISKDLLPSSLENFGLSKAVLELCEKLNTPTTTVSFKESHEASHLSQREELLIFRMIQELLNNAIKHADASAIKVTINWGAVLAVSVSDNGKGFDLEEIKGDIKKGVGLYSIENRASLLGGEVTFKSTIGEGSIVTIILEPENTASGEL